jgi:hypothetical protein
MPACLSATIALIEPLFAYRHKPGPAVVLSAFKNVCAGRFLPALHQEH